MENQTKCDNDNAKRLPTYEAPQLTILGAEETESGTTADTGEAFGVYYLPS